MKALWKWLEGKKTYIGAAITAAAGVLAVTPLANPRVQLAAQIVLAIGGAGTAAALGHKMDRTQRSTTESEPPQQ